MGTAMVSGVITGLGNLRKGISEPATHANKRWTYHILERWFRQNFQSNRLYESKEAKRYKFYIVKAC